MRGSRLAAMVIGMAVLAATPMVRAETVFSNENATAAQARPQAQAEFVLAKPMLITSVKVATTGAAQASPIRLYCGGKLLYIGRATVQGKYQEIQPNMIFPAGRYVVNAASDTWAWNQGSGKAGMATVAADPLPAADVAVASEYFGLTQRPVRSADLRSKLKDLKQRIDAQAAGLSTSADKRGGLADLQRERNARTAGMNEGSEGGTKKPLGGLENNNITSGRHTDTFGGERINRGRSGSPGDFRGGGAGHAMDGDEDPTEGNTEAQDTADTISQLLSDLGGKSTGSTQGDAEEVAYAMSVGSDGWEATKNMSKSERESYWSNEANRQRWGEAGRPREDQDSYGGWRPFGSRKMREAQRRFLDRAISARKGAAGGGVQQQSGGPVRFPTGADDRPERERGAGTLNWDRILFINTLVNPVRH